MIAPRFGYVLVSGGAVRPARGLPELSRLLAAAHGRAEHAQAKAKPTAGSERELTAYERAELLERTAHLLTPRNLPTAEEF